MMTWSIWISERSGLLKPLCEIVFSYSTWWPSDKTPHLLGIYLPSDHDHGSLSKILSIGILSLKKKRSLEYDAQIVKMVQISAYFDLSLLDSKPKCLFNQGYLYIFRAWQCIRFHPFSLEPEVLPSLATD